MITNWFGRQRRRLFGSYRIDDPRPIAADAPYTFYLPSENELLAVAPGDLVKLIVRPVPPGSEWDAERMWVKVATTGQSMTGLLENIPFDMPQLRLGSAIDFRRNDIIDIEWSPDRVVPPPSGLAHRWYWERCMVDDCVLRGACPVDYLYREDSDMTEDGDAFPDSGWRIRGTDAAVTQDGIDGRTPQYVALGAVLNRDDRWLALIDAPVGSAFIRNAGTGDFGLCEGK